MAINRKHIIEMMSKVEAIGNEEGLIPAYNVFVTQLPASFWNRFAERLTRQVNEDMLEVAQRAIKAKFEKLQYIDRENI